MSCHYKMCLMMYHSIYYCYNSYRPKCNVMMLFSDSNIFYALPGKTITLFDTTGIISGFSQTHDNDIYIVCDGEMIVSVDYTTIDCSKLKSCDQNYAVYVSVIHSPFCYFQTPSISEMIGVPYSTRYSQVVTHPSTNRAGRGLTSVILREPVCITPFSRTWAHIVVYAPFKRVCQLRMC